MIDPPNRPAAIAAAGAIADEVTVLVSVDPEAGDCEQVRLMNGIERAPVALRSVREAAFEVQGALFLPRGCQVAVDFRCDAGFDSSSEEPLRAMHVRGVVHKVSMLDGQPTYVLKVNVLEDPSGALPLLRLTGET